MVSDSTDVSTATTSATASKGKQCKLGKLSPQSHEIWVIWQCIVCVCVWGGGADPCTSIYLCVDEEGRTQLFGIGIIILCVIHCCND